MKKIMFTIMLLLIAVGCGKKEENKKTHLTFMVNFQATERISEAFNEVINDFQAKNQDIEIEFFPGSSDYEAVMKTKMASNDLPDMWSTHGWSVARYSEYLEPLQNEKWAVNLSPSIKPVITDSKGRIFVLPLDVDVAGVAYNKDVVAKAGVNVDDIKTWTDFLKAMGQVREIGVTPVHIGGKDSWPVGNFVDWLAPAVYVTNPDHDSSNDLKAGIFDQDKWDSIGQVLKEMQIKNFLNRDVLTSGYTDSARALGTGKAAFAFYGNYVITEAWGFNPEANLGFFPIPSYHGGDDQFLISGERTTVGIWKDSKHKKEAKMFLDYLATPEVMSKLATATGIPAGLTTAHSDTGRLSGDYEKYANTLSTPYFDREYLPGGIWDTLCSTSSGVLSGDMNIKDASKKVAEDFKRLYKK